MTLFCQIKNFIQVRWRPSEFMPIITIVIFVVGNLGGNN